MKRTLFATIIIISLIGCNKLQKTEIVSHKENTNLTESIIEKDESVEEKQSNIFKKGDIVQLFDEKQWNVKTQQWVKATKVSIYSDKRSLTDEHIIATYPNGTKAEIIDVYEEILTGGSIWRVYKVKTKNSPSKEGWIADFNVAQYTPD